MTKQYGLAIHTSSPELGFAISNFAGDARAHAWNLGRDVSNQLHDRLLEFIPPQTWSDLAFIAVAQGPGGFTGTRLGVVLARTLAQQLQIPLFGISSLATIAYRQIVQTPNSQTPIAIQMPAQRGDIYAAIYQAPNPPTAIITDMVLHPEKWQEKLIVYQPQLIEAPVEQGQFAPELLSIAYYYWKAGDRPKWEEVLPYYGQHPVTFQT